MSSERERAMLACAAASPVAVAAHDKPVWLGLFADDGEVCDPVGSRPHRGAAALSRFYDTFIAPNDVRFEVDLERVCGDTVVRDVTIRIRMSTGLEVTVPAHLRYELGGAPQALRIHRLSAHWELLPMVLRTLRTGWIGLRTYSRLSLHMLRCQGIGGVFGFMRAFLGVGQRGKRRVEALLCALRDGDQGALRRLLGQDAAVDALPMGNDTLQWHKLIAAGRHVTASVHDGTRSGVALFELDRRGGFRQLQFYWA